MKRVLFFCGILFLLLPGAAQASPVNALVPSFEITGWIPYWREAPGTADVLPHIKSFSALMPFGYIVQDDGSLHDAFNFSTMTATSTAAILRAAARETGVKIVPSVMWSNGAATHAILSSGPSRRALAARIAALVMENDFDGIDIDFEGKFAKTRPYFSLFLEGLYARLGQKWLYCTIEPRTPPSSAFAVIPDKLEYANDYTAINTYCDRVQIMAYDQGAIDLRLNAAANSKPYIPVADVEWVRKVITLAAKTIPKKKLIIGIPTYGYEYDLIPLAQGYRYKLRWAVNPGYANTLATQLGLTPKRNSAGEMSLVYFPTTTSQTASAIPDPLRIMWWSDASAIKDKIQLAKELGVRGVAIFKLDGGQDPGLWDVLPKK